MSFKRAKRTQSFVRESAVIKFAPRHSPTEKCGKFVGVYMSLYGCLLFCERVHNERAAAVQMYFVYMCVHRGPT
jgi:hypothetical protein